MEKIYRKKLNSHKLDILNINSFQSTALLIVLSLMISFFYRVEYGEVTYKPFVYTAWLPSVFAIYAFKLFCAVLYRRKSFRAEDEKFWFAVFYFTTFLTGLSIGSSILFVADMSNQISKIFILLFISALCSGSVSILSTSKTAFIIFNSLALFPYIFHYINSDMLNDRIVGYLILLFVATIYLTAYRINRSLINALSLKIDNDLIIEKLSQSEDKFSKSFYSGIAPMAMIDYGTARIIDANNALLELLEYSRENLIGKTPYDLDLSENPGDLIDIVAEAVTAGRLFNREVSLKTRGGAVKHCFITVERFNVDNSTIAYLMLQDFTERLEYERRLEVERERAEQAADAKSKFLASMSHEIRTPMNSILGMTQLALLTDDENERREYLDTVQESAEYLLVLINDILDISKIEAGMVELDIIDADLQKLVNSVYRAMELYATNRKLKFTLNIDRDVPEFIKCPPERLKQILINLIGNALKFTPKGSVTLHVAVSDGIGYNHSSSSKEFLEFSVTDTGIGIPEDKQKMIFESFTQANSSTFRKYGGTGLGLSISKQLIKMMNGDIRVRSAPGEGSTFSFVIPLITGTAPEKQKIDAMYAPCSDVRKVLIAEDNILNRKLIEACMKKLGHEFSMAENGEEAIELVKNQRFDVILMDLEMPVLDGLESMKRIRDGAAGEERKNIAIYAMSAHVLKKTIDKCIAEGFNGYITKPVDLKKLKEIL